jgi:hypothetical protein
MFDDRGRQTDADIGEAGRSGLHEWYWSHRRRRRDLDVMREPVP